MDIKTIPCEFIISDVPDHNIHKDILLKLIDKIPNNPYYQVSKTDYNLPDDFEREYATYFYSKIVPHYSTEIRKYYRSAQCQIVKTWFQQYEEKSSHPYHMHPGANFTSVYFLELPDEQFKTSIKIREKEYDYEAKEGQIITFPAHVLHTSKENGKLRKTVLSFNSNFIY
jgi:hypothetical protein